MKLSIKHFNILAFFLMKFFLVTSFNSTAHASNYDHSILKQASDSEWTQSLKRADRLGNDDTADLVRWMYVKSDNKKAQQDSRITWQDMKALIEEHSYWPAQTSMKTVLEAKMPFDKHDFDVIAWFDEHSPVTTRGMKIYLAELEERKDYDKIASKVNQWWPVIMIKPEDQAYFLVRYGKHIEKESHIARMHHLIERGHYTNAKSIAKLLGRDYQRLANARIVTRRDIKNDRAYSDGAVSNAIAAVPANLKDDVGLVYDRLKWRRVHDLNTRASEILLNPPAAEDVADNAKAWWRERHIIIRRHLDKKEYKKAYDLAASNAQSEGVSYSEAEWMAGWISLQFLGDAKAALKHFYNMRSVVKTPISLSRHHYWLGRSFEKLGDKVNADENFNLAAEFPTTYYGILAAGYVEQPHRIQDIKSTKLSAEAVNAFDGDARLTDIFESAQALHEVGYNNSANQFLLSASDVLADEELGKLYVAQKAEEIGKVNISVLLSRQAAMKHEFFPQQYAYPVRLDSMDSVEVQRYAVVHGIIRQESLFDQYAQSGAGAKGYMQLMPATARQVAREEGLGYKNNWLKDRPEYNIALGSAYLGSLLVKYDNAYPLAAAAYNAGPHRVNKWLKQYGDPRKGDINWVDWVELIPFSETRNYVMRVTEGASVYRYMLQNYVSSQMPIDQSGNHLYYGIKH